MKLFGMKFRDIIRDTAEEGGNNGGGEQPDRLVALEQRLGKLAQVVTGFAQETQQTRQQQQVDQERQRTLAAAQGFVTTAQQKLTAAQTKLAAAHDSGDAQAIAAATAEISSAAAEHTAARMHAESMRAQYQNAPASQQQTQQRVDDTNLRDWRERNKSWYGVDGEMTRAALEVAKEVEGERILEVGSTQYFQAIDARLRTRYGDRMPRTNSGAAQMQSQRGSMSGNPPQTQNRIPEAVAAGWRRMGINVDDPAVAKQMQDARQTAVRKGFLPETPQYGQVVSR
jgi:hypothetical protein